MLNQYMAAGLLLFYCGGASAQIAGSRWVKLGYNNIAPKVSSGDLSAPSLPGTQVDIGNASAWIFTGGYMFSDHISAELILGVPYKHDIYAVGSQNGVGKIGSVKQLPPTVFAQYRFGAAAATWRPYVGIGVTYAFFRNEHSTSTLTALSNPGGVPTTFSVKNAWGITPQIGLTYALNEKWYVDGVINKTFIKTAASLSTGQTIDLRLDPLSVALSIGYRF